MDEAADAARPTRARARWPRRALVGLWVAVFVLASVGLASRWDSLVMRLARPPLGASASGGGLR